jgi:hypothetical protein
MIHRSSSWSSAMAEFSGVRRNVRVKRKAPLNSFLDQSRTQTACTDADTLVAFANYGTNGLNIGVEDSSGFVVRVTDIVTGYWFLLANFTHKCHGYTPSHCVVNKICVRIVP